jgi:microcystin-dependent protein
MADPYIGEVRMFGGNFAPLDWAFCNGQLLQISQNPALYSLIGTTYGGDGQNTFALPNLQSRVPLHQGTGAQGQSYPLGQAAGEETHTLTTTELPNHTHAVAAIGKANAARPNNALYGGATSFAVYAAAPGGAMNAGVVARNNAATLGHSNIMPYLVINFIIALNGIYPSQG